MKEKTCPKCHGRQVVMVKDKQSATGIKVPESCPKCKGKGKIQG